MSDALKKHQERSERLREKIGRAVHCCRSPPVGAPMAIFDALGSFFGMLRDYGETPSWFRTHKWEHDHEVVEEGRLDDNLKSREEDGWQLVSVLFIEGRGGLERSGRRMYPDRYHLFFKRPT